MAIDQSEKRRAAALDMIGCVDALMDNMYRLNNLVEAFQSGGGSFSDADFTDDTRLKHIDANAINLVISNAPTLLNHLKTNSIDDVFNAVRPR